MAFPKQSHAPQIDYIFESAIENVVKAKKAFSKVLGLQKILNCLVSRGKNLQ